MLNSIPVEKRIAIRLYPLSWLVRFRLLKRLPSDIRLKVKTELKQLKAMKLTDVNSLLSNINVSRSEALNTVNPSLVKVTGLGFTESFEQLLLETENRPPMLSQAIDEVLVELAGNR